MTQVIRLHQAGDVGVLECSPLCLVAGRVGVQGIIRQVELLDRFVATALLTDNDDPRLLALAGGIEKFELGVGDASVLRVVSGRLGSVALPNELNQALAGIDLLA
ncbi:hypothetical protein [Azotobacter chroococcum]|uniref:hypothetical protein n=1 Tax=Azotobacter chroococcum TaxID=353 RepID=UPI001EEFC8FC|nr:hypothetical protein [Azotobacter chroococcum]